MMGGTLYSHREIQLTGATSGQDVMDRTLCNHREIQPTGEKNRSGTVWVGPHATAAKATLRKQQQGGNLRAGPMYRMPRWQFQGETP